jgi:hypothetical protein
MYMSLAIGLVSDLGLDHEMPSVKGFNSFSTEGLLEGSEFSKAAKRAYLGSYYMSSA